MCVCLEGEGEESPFYPDVERRRNASTSTSLSLRREREGEEQTLSFSPCRDIWGGKEGRRELDDGVKVNKVVG